MQGREDADHLVRTRESHRELDVVGGVELRSVDDGKEGGRTTPVSPRSRADIRSRSPPELASSTDAADGRNVALGSTSVIVEGVRLVLTSSDSELKKVSWTFPARCRTQARSIRWSTAPE